MVSEQSFVQQLVQESLPVWEQCLHSEFLERLADGTLDEACFKGYIVEDSLYLREYAKVFAWGMTKAADMQTIRTYYSLLSFVNENEDAERLHCLRQFGLTDEGIQSLPLRPERSPPTVNWPGSWLSGWRCPICPLRRWAARWDTTPFP